MSAVTAAVSHPGVAQVAFRTSIRCLSLGWVVTRFGVPVIGAVSGDGFHRKVQAGREVRDPDSGGAAEAVATPTGMGVNVCHVGQRAKCERVRSLATGFRYTSDPRT